MNVIVEIPGSGMYFGGPTQRRHVGGTNWDILKSKPANKKPSKYQTPSRDILSVMDAEGTEIARYQPGNWKAVWLEAETPAPPAEKDEPEKNDG